ncbi:Potassium channel [Microbotryomycetes sp. JL201]|nr:Potassium channel [Microbotryomycetes sp. JL201]
MPDDLYDEKAVSADSHSSPLSQSSAKGEADMKRVESLDDGKDDRVYALDHAQQQKVDSEPQGEQHDVAAQQAPDRDDEEEHHDKGTRHGTHRYLPIVSGLLVPFSVLLDIPGLTERWYQRTVGYKVVETKPNPPLLDVGQAVSMFFGVAANAALVMRFLEKRPYQMTWVAIASLTLHDILQLVIVLTFGIIHSVNDGFTYGTAYWMTVASTAASLTVNVTLVVDLVRTPDFRSKGSGLTEKQRSLVIAVMSLLVYIGLGSLCYTFLIDPHLSYIDSMYFTITTIETVGFGDITPNTLQARIVAFFYNTVGIIMLGFTVAIARETIIETFEASYRARRDALAVKARERKEERRKRLRERHERREKELRSRLIAEGVQDVDAEVEALKQSGMFDKHALAEANRNVKQPEGDALPSPVACSNVQVMQAANRVAQARRELDFFEERREGLGPVRSAWRWLLRSVGLLKTFDPLDREARRLGTSQEDELEGRQLTRTATMSSIMSGASHEEQFKSFKKQIQAEQRKEFQLKLTIALALFFVFWLVGAAVFSATENWTYFEALYFCYIFFSTIGYGDYSPKSAGGRAFFIAWSLLSVSVMTLLLSVVTETWSSRYRSTIADGSNRKLLKRGKQARSQTADAAIAKLLATEGYSAQAERINAKDLPGKLIDALKGFHDHARFFMLGRTGDPPERFRNLVDGLSEVENALNSLADESEAGIQGDTKHFLFMLSYERQFDVLMDAAEQVGKVFQAHQDELEKMRRLNAELKEALSERSESLKKKATDGGGGIFVKRPAGGYEDEQNEEELEQELDEPDTEDNAECRQGSALDTSSAMLDRLHDRAAEDQVRLRRAEPVLRPPNQTGSSVGSFSPALSAVVDQAMQSRTLTFADAPTTLPRDEPDTPRSRRPSQLWQRVRDAANFSH